MNLNLLNVTNILRVISYHFIYSVISRFAGWQPAGFIKLNSVVEFFENFSNFLRLFLQNTFHRMFETFGYYFHQKRSYFKVDALKNFEKFTGKYQCQSLFFKKETLAQWYCFCSIHSRQNASRKKVYCGSKGYLQRSFGGKNISKG